MTRLEKNEHGFVGAELILAIVVIALLIVIGWLAYSRHHQASTKTTTPSISSNSHKVGDIFQISEGRTFGSPNVTSSNPQIISIISSQLNGCKPEAGCATTTITVKALKTGQATITDTRQSCGEAMACTGSNGIYKTTVTIE